MLDSATILAKTNTATLPKVYENATMALSTCSEVDECKDWSDKAEALRSYARQSKDEQLEKMCVRIRARAIRRCGELLKEIDGRGGDRKSGGVPTFDRPPIKKVDAPRFDIGASSRRDAAASAGLSEEQQKTAVRVANVPLPNFERQVESDDPPTVTELAEQGTRSRLQPVHETKPEPEKKPKSHVPAGSSIADFQAATHALATTEEFHDFCRRVDWDSVKRGSHGFERETLRQHVAGIKIVMQQFEDSL